MGGFPGFLWVPKVPRRKFHGLRAFGAFGTKSKGDQNKNKVGFKPSELPELPHTKKKENFKKRCQNPGKNSWRNLCGGERKEKSKKGKKGQSNQSTNSPCSTIQTKIFRSAAKDTKRERRKDKKKNLAFHRPYLPLPPSNPSRPCFRGLN